VTIVSWYGKLLGEPMVEFIATEVAFLPEEIKVRMSLSLGFAKL
jgi:hypothetical protein